MSIIDADAPVAHCLFCGQQLSFYRGVRVARPNQRPEVQAMGGQHAWFQRPHKCSREAIERWRKDLRDGQWSLAT